MGCLNCAKSWCRISYFTHRYCLQRSKEARTKTRTHACGPKRTQVKQHQKKKKKAECLLWFAEPGGLQAQHWRSVMQTEQNATSTEAPANSLFSHDMFRPRLL